MKQYQAAEKFIELLKSNPQDFSASIDSGRDHYMYIIKNNYRAVSIRIDSNNNNVLSNSPQTANDLNFVPSEELNFLGEWVQKRIAEDKIQKQIDSDNELINNLLEYYEECKD